MSNFRKLIVALAFVGAILIGGGSVAQGPPNPDCPIPEVCGK